MAYDIEDFSNRFLMERKAFLLSRAEVAIGDGPQPPHGDHARQATLFLQAAAVAAMADEISEARNLFARAADAFTDLGMPVGVLLAKIAYPHDTVPVPDPLLALWTGELGLTSEDESNGETGLGFQRYLLAPTALAVPQQLLHLNARAHIDESLMSALPELDSLAAPHMDRPVSCLHVPLADYWRMFSFLAQYDVTPALRGRLNRLAALRLEALTRMREDKWHWMRLPNPVDILDLDLLAFCVVALLYGRRGMTTDYLNNALSEKNALLRLPLTVAEHLIG